MFFRVKFSSSEWCGFDTQKVFEAESEEDIYNLPEYQNAFEEQEDYQHGWTEEGQEPDKVVVEIEEITAEEYAEEVEWQIQ